MSEKRIIKTLYGKLVSRIADQAMLNRYDKWVILNLGMAKLTDKEAGYDVTVRIAPAEWVKTNSSWQQLSLDERKKTILYANIKLEEAGTIIPGALISNKGRYAGISGDEMVVPIPAEYNLIEETILSNCLGPTLLKTLPYFHYASTLPCYVIQGSEGIKFIIPKSEFVRYYFFVGSEIIKTICKNEHTSHVSIPGHLFIGSDKNNLHTRVARVEIKEGYSKKEKIVFANMALNPNFKNSVDNIYGKFLVEQTIVEQQNKKLPSGSKSKIPSTFVQTSLFHQNEFRMGTTGIFLGKEKKIFIVHQIHQTNEKLMFNLLVSIPKDGDHRRLADKDEREKLDTKEYKNSSKVPVPGSDPDFRPEDKSGFSSDITMLQNEVKEYNFFDDVEEIQVITPEKLYQDAKYENMGNFQHVVGNSFTTDFRRGSDSHTLRGALENIPLPDQKQNEILIYEKLKELVKTIQSHIEVKVSYYNHFTLAFQEEEHIIFNSLTTMNIVVLSFECFGGYFYLVDLYGRSKNLKRAQIIHGKHNEEIATTTIDQLIQKLKDFGYSWRAAYSKLNWSHIIKKGFNHNLDENEISPADLADKVIDYIKKNKPKDPSIL